MTFRLHKGEIENPMHRWWIKLWRKLQDDELWKNPEPFNKRDAWIDLLLMTWSREKKFIIGSKVVNLQPGQIFLSYRFLCSRWHWSRHKLSDYFKLLKDLKKVKFETRSEGTLITVLNWKTYQHSFEVAGTQTAPETERFGDTSGTLKGQNKECIKNDKESKRIHTLVELYNSTCDNLSKIKTVSQSRKRRIKIRLKEYPDLGWWKVVFEKSNSTPFLRGENKSGWRVNFDWLIANDKNALKVYEGQYEKERFSGIKQWLQQEQKNGQSKQD